MFNPLSSAKSPSRDTRKFCPLMSPVMRSVEPVPEARRQGKGVECRERGRRRLGGARGGRQRRARLVAAARLVSEHAVRHADPARVLAGGERRGAGARHGRHGAVPAHVRVLLGLQPQRGDRRRHRRTRLRAVHAVRVGRRVGARRYPAAHGRRARHAAHAAAADAAHRRRRVEAVHRACGRRLHIKPTEHYTTGD